MENDLTSLCREAELLVYHCAPTEAAVLIPPLMKDECAL